MRSGPKPDLARRTRLRLKYHASRRRMPAARIAFMESILAAHARAFSSACTSLAGRSIANSSQPWRRGERHSFANHAQIPSAGSIRPRLCDGSIRTVTQSPVTRSRWLPASVLICLFSAVDATGDPVERAQGVSPPVQASLEASDSVNVDLGRALFKKDWAAADPERGGRKADVGPLFNATACDTCHRGGAHGEGPIADGPVPVSLVILLESPRSTTDAEPDGDPVYGRVFNTAAAAGTSAEGVVTVKYHEISGGYYPGGGRWAIRDPEYRLERLGYGPLAPQTVLMPRIAPSLSGVGQLEAVPDDAILTQASGQTLGRSPWRNRGERRFVGRFGWQSNEMSVHDQTVKAFALEMGLTSLDRSSNDSTPTESACRSAGPTVRPEVSESAIKSVVTFVKTLAIPPSSPLSVGRQFGADIFENLGCDACHRSQLPIEIHAGDGAPGRTVIAAYTDMRVHDLGVRMSDRDVAGNSVSSLWRTAPLWGIGHRISTERNPTFLHDGRARTVEEAILWHSGEASDSQRRFTGLSPGRRRALLTWLESL